MLGQYYGPVTNCAVAGDECSRKEWDLIPLGLLQAKSYMANNAIMKNML